MNKPTSKCKFPNIKKDKCMLQYDKNDLLNYALKCHPNVLMHMSDIVNLIENNKRNLTNEEIIELFYYYMKTTEGLNKYDEARKRVYNRYSTIIESKKYNKTIDGVIITGRTFGLIELCRYFLEKYNTSKEVKLSKIFLYRNKNKYNYDIPIYYIDDAKMREDGPLRASSPNIYDECHFKDLSNMTYNGNYLVIDSDLFFTDYVDLSLFDREYYYASWFLTINDITKYWISFPFVINNHPATNDISTKFIHINRGITIENTIREYIKTDKIDNWAINSIKSL